MRQPRYLAHHLHRLFQILRRDLMVQPPHDVHGPAALVADIICRTEECIWRGTAGILLEFTHKQEDFAVLLLVVNIPLAGRRISIGRGLALPMEQAGADRIIVVERGR